MANAKSKEAQKRPERGSRTTEILVWVAVLGATVGILALLANLPPEWGRLKMADTLQQQGTWGVTQPDGIYRWGRTGLSVREGDTMEMLGSSGARMRLNEGSMLAVDADTALVVGMEGNVRTLEVTKGRVLLLMGEGAQATVVKTPRGQLRLAQAVETEVRIAATEAQVMVISGQLEVSGAGSEKNIRAGAGDVVRMRGTSVEAAKMPLQGMMGHLWWSTTLGVKLPASAPAGTRGPVAAPSAVKGP